MHLRKTPFILSLLFPLLQKISAINDDDYDFADNADDIRRTSYTCDCPRQTYGEEYDHAELKKPAMKNCEFQHCVFQVILNSFSINLCANADFSGHLIGCQIG
ncbi:hypothetical protein ANCCAN_02315 [Ancylostoma caninum]|uniref:Uncharacterized protein n=1 Tax=Ancylostoma caninum TaxID=29170 RepID=A0A368H8K3_ANCCA|nr:hypothetical protein ANCCAN_02315 [Ancylostoma caninum]